MAGYLSCELGQTDAHLKFHSDAGTLDLFGPGINLAFPLEPQWMSLIEGALTAHPEHSVDTVVMSSPGVEGAPAETLTSLLPQSVTTVAIAHDAVASYLGTLGLATGCMITAGSDTACLAVGEREAVRVDGWGHVMGDAGSAYWIGRSALEAAVRGYDGRRQMTELTSMLLEEYPTIETAYLSLLQDPDRIAHVAAFAQRVDELATTDRVAGDILDKAAAHLSEAVTAAIRRVSLQGPQPPHVVAMGGVFASHRVLRRFTDYLTLQWPTFALAEPAGTTLDGVEKLLTVPPTHPLSPLVSIARR